MSILIKGMEIPTSCSRCFCMASCRLWKNIMHPEFNRHRNCPLVPVPPHGRLIDADALSAKLNTMLSMAFGEGNTAFHFAYRSLGKVVENAPTIIEEEGET